MDLETLAVDGCVRANVRLVTLSLSFFPSAESWHFWKEVNHILSIRHKMSCVVRKPDLCKCENKGADQLRGDQRLCFRYINISIPLLP